MNLTDVPPPSPTTYKEPAATLTQFPSSLISGVTGEGGIHSVTFKTVQNAEYVERSHLMREALIPPSSEKILINDLPICSEEYLNALKEDLKKEEPQAPLITDFHEKLEAALEHRTNLSEIGKEIFADYEKHIPGRKVIVLKKDHFKVSIPEIKGMTSDVSKEQEVEKKDVLDVIPIENMGSVDVDMNMDVMDVVDDLMDVEAMEDISDIMANDPGSDASIDAL